MKRYLLSLLIVGLVTPGTTAALSSAGNKPPLSYAVQNTWRRLGECKLSNDGRWLAYTIRIGWNGDGILIVRDLATGHEYREPQAELGSFTEDNRYFIFLISSTSTLRILNITNGSVISYEHVVNFKLVKNHPELLAFLSESSLTIRNLNSGKDQMIANVTDYGFTADGDWMVYIRRADGVFVRRSDQEESRAVVSGAALYADLTFSKNNPQFAFTSTTGTSKDSGTALYYWDARQPYPAHAILLVGPSTPGLLPGYTVDAQGALDFSADGKRLFLLTGPISIPKQKADARFEIWSTKEPITPGMVNSPFRFGRPRNSPAVVFLPQRRFVQLGTRTLTDLVRNDNPRFALLKNPVPYYLAYSWAYATCSLPFLYCNVYLVDLSNGHRRKIDTMSQFAPSLSPNGSYVANFDGVTHRWYLIRTSDLHRIQLAVPDVHFENEDWDRPRDPEPYSYLRWSQNGKYVFVSDRYDIWVFSTTTGVGQNLTRGYGRAHTIQFSGYLDFMHPDPYAGSQIIDTSRPIFLQGVNLRTRAFSLYRMNFNTQGALPKQLVQQDALLDVSSKARDADVVAVTRERFDMVPNVYVTTRQFRRFRQVTDIEPRQREYAWGHSKLINYVNADGRNLQAILTIPGNFDPRRKYPMVVSIYERQTNIDFNHFVMPVPASTADLNAAWYASNGYIVLQPDIVYTTGHPGLSALHCVTAAVKRAIAMGFVNSKRIGLAGHSWGGFETDFIITHSHLFAVAISGAGITDYVSYYGTLRDTGDFGAAMMEHWQGRVGGTLWDRFNLYVENSAILRAPYVTTPLLMLANDGDGNIPWSQGLELFFALRRLGKQAWLINYHGQNHDLNDLSDQEDWTIRMDQFFNHYLKGAPAPHWMLHPTLRASVR